MSCAWLVVVSTVLAGCGRLGFDASAIEGSDAAATGDASGEVGSFVGGTSCIFVPDAVG